MKTCRRHSWVWIPRPDATFTNHSTGELVTIDLGVCQHCGAYKARVTAHSPGQQISAHLWGQNFEGLNREP